MRKEWTKEEDEFIRENYKEMTHIQMAKALGRTKASINHFCSRRGLFIQKEVVVGDRFERLVIEEIYTKFNGIQNLSFAKCKCDCGKETNPRITALTQNKIKSCGCLKAEKARERCKIKNIKHSLTGHKLYSVYCGMKVRCLYKNHYSYKNYGGRGIKICQEWLDDFKKFYDWAILTGWIEGLTIDRIDCNGNYCPENCRIATIKEQANNKRNSRFITAWNETKTLAQWSEDNRCKTTPVNIHRRIQLGWSPENAIKTPPLTTTKHLGEPK